MDQTTPPPAFHFLVSFSGVDPPITDLIFQEVSGLESKIETSELREDEENSFVHHLPGAIAHPNLKLKRCLTTADSALIRWCKSVLESDFAKVIAPKDIDLSLINDLDRPVAAWSITNAYPIAWELGAFDAMKNELAIAAIELNYASITRKL